MKWQWSKQDCHQRSELEAIFALHDTAYEYSLIMK